ncbi:hypothetical protein P9239_00170 [Caballeronia sp. LZ062]|uniref:hypothetical protein n=1 Tax=unclassified Caballeronia TaxID=2646786 RepID=UPI002867A627|nr:MULTISPECIES: hypothetical protein [unclassified Caballeronia]MDR5856643.1 hypothetical protein [Caballeronia sp. LZ050]MDR5868771.1 hypothetical protein [Caballeronia sp. LZ062]
MTPEQMKDLYERAQVEEFDGWKDSASVYLASSALDLSAEPIYQVYAAGTWEDVDKDAFEAASIRSDIPSRIVYLASSGQASPAARSAGPVAWISDEQRKLLADGIAVTAFASRSFQSNVALYLAASPAAPSSDAQERAITEKHLATFWRLSTGMAGTIKPRTALRRLRRMLNAK